MVCIWTGGLMKTLLRSWQSLHMASGALAVSIIGVLVWATPAWAQNSNASSGSTQSQNTGSLGNGWLAFAVLTAGAGLSLGLIIVVSRDRRQGRDKVLEAIKAGANTVSQTDTPLYRSEAFGIVATPKVSITADHDSIDVGGTATLTASYREKPQPCMWSFEPSGIVKASGSGPNTDVVITAVKAGSVTATATAHDPSGALPDPPPSGTKTITVNAPRGSTVSFAILGAGLGTAVLSIMAISGAIALALRGDFTSEIGTLLGTALGAGAAGTVSAVHGASATAQSQKSSPPSQD